MNKLITAAIAISCFVAASISNAQVTLETFHTYGDFSGAEVGIVPITDEDSFSGPGLFQSFFTGHQTEAEFSTEVAFNPATNQLMVDLFLDTRITDFDPEFAEGISELAVIATFAEPATVVLTGISSDLLVDVNFEEVTGAGQSFQVEAGDFLNIVVFDTINEFSATDLVRTGSLTFSVGAEGIPEPSTLPILGLGLLGAAQRRKHKLA